MAVLIAVLAVAGFWPTFWGPMATGSFDLHWLLVVHGTILYGWLALLLAQTVLVYRGRTDLHQQLGTWVGIGVGILVVLSGLSVSFGILSPSVGTTHESLQSFISSLLFLLPDAVIFAVLFGAGIAYRTRPATHKRLMLVATLIVLPAATVRIFTNGVDLSPLMSKVFGRAIPVLIAGLAFGRDWWTRGRVHPAYWFGAAMLFLSGGIAFLSLTDAWTNVTGQIAAWLESVLRPLMG